MLDPEGDIQAIGEVFGFTNRLFDLLERFTQALLRRRRARREECKALAQQILEAYRRLTEAAVNDDEEAFWDEAATLYSSTHLAAERRFCELAAKRAALSCDNLRRGLEDRRFFTHGDITRLKWGISSLEYSSYRYVHGNNLPKSKIPLLRPDHFPPKPTPPFFPRQGRLLQKAVERVQDQLDAYRDIYSTYVNTTPANERHRTYRGSYRLITEQILAAVPELREETDAFGNGHLPSNVHLAYVLSVIHTQGRMPPWPQVHDW